MKKSLLFGAMMMGLMSLTGCGKDEKKEEDVKVEAPAPIPAPVEAPAAAGEPVAEAPTADAAAPAGSEGDAATLFSFQDVKDKAKAMGAKAESMGTSALQKFESTRVGQAMEAGLGEAKEMGMAAEQKVMNSEPVQMMKRGAEEVKDYVEPKLKAGWDKAKAMGGAVKNKITGQ